MSAAGAARFDRWHLDAERLARGLLGQVLVRVDRGRRISGVIVETEAYLGGDDLGSHSAGGRRTPRNESMFLAGGHSYIYLVYGMHHCFNVVAAPEGRGCAVLIRAIEPLEGIGIMARRAGMPVVARGAAHSTAQLRRLGSGPGRICRSLGLDRSLDREPLASSSRLFIERGRRPGPRTIATGARIGIPYAGEWALAPLRFGIAPSPYLSQPFR